MESVIRDGTLRLLTAESTCDVILSCHGRRLMAHKVILSMASPVFRDLLKEDSTDPTVIILPDISVHTMSLILDYIYTGSVIVYSNTIKQFLSLAKLLEIHLNFDFHLSETPEDCSSKELFKKLPQLIPIDQFRKSKCKKRANTCVIPSPWKPSVETIFGDPRDDILISSNIQHDTNNNFQYPMYNNCYQNRKSPENSTTDNYFLSNLNTSKNDNDTLTSTISRPPEDVAIDRDKSNTNVQKITLTEITVNFKEESNSSIQCELVKNELENNKDKPFKCEECGKCFSQLRNFKYHRSVHKGTKEFAAKCSECGKIFNDKGYLSSHMKIHRDRKEYACPQCPKRFNQRVAYNMHLRIHTGIKPHECPTCGKSFSRKMLLKQHQRVHTGERPYSCPECGKTFADRSNMSLHARLHTGVKPYACNLCSKSFTKKHHLKTHMNFHTGLKPYKCERCNLAFSQSSNMRTHYKKCLLKSSEIDEEENK